MRIKCKMTICRYLCEIIMEIRKRGYTSTRDTTKQFHPTPRITFVKLENGGVKINLLPFSDSDSIVWMQPYPENVEDEGKVVFIDKPAVYKCFSISATKIESEAVVFDLKNMLQTPSIVKYEVTPASTAHSKDGRVQVHTQNVPPSATCKFIWSTGVITTEPILRNVRPGTYVAVILSIDNVFVECHHACSPAQVEVRSESISSFRL